MKCLRLCRRKRLLFVENVKASFYDAIAVLEINMLRVQHFCITTEVVFASVFYSTGSLSEVLGIHTISQHNTSFCQHA